jgi:hypothetical protein
MARIDEILQLVGRLNYVWTNTESLFIYLIAHLAGTDKEAAIVIFLTLNTTRARLDLLERLAKMGATPAETRTQILALTGRLKQESRLRNKYNHCIYSFDEHGEFGSTQLMRIAEFDDDLKYGKVEVLDQDEILRIQSAIGEVTAVNKSIWGFIRSNHIET